MSDLPSPVLYAIPFFVLTLAAEAWLIRKRKDIAGYEWRDTATSLLMGSGSQLFGLLSAGAVFALAVWLHRFALFEIPLWTWWAWPLCFVLDDFAYYWFHRSAHRVRWFWAAHVNHHSSEHYNLSTALRQTWTGFVAGSFLFRLPLFLTGFPPEMVFFCAGLNLVYQYWIHTEAVKRMPRWFEAVMNTPSHHRVHHATNARYLDTNYAGVFIVWDRMLGTFEPEDDADAPRYGIVTPLRSFNIFKVAFHEWAGIAKDVARAPWRHKLGYIWREPGWSHDGSRETSATIRKREGIER